MMTREEFLLAVQTISLQETVAGVRELETHLSDHDQAQRVAIARLKVEYKDLVLRNKLLRDRPDLPLERIQAYDEVITKIEQQAKEIARLQAEKENAALLEALQLLYDCQNGCPLPKYETDWTRAMQLSERVLKELGR